MVRIDACICNGGITYTKSFPAAPGSFFIGAFRRENNPWFTEGRKNGSYNKSGELYVSRKM